MWWWWWSNWMWWNRTRDWFLLSAEEEYWFLPTANQFWESCSTWVTQWWNIESRCDPRIKYFTKYLWNWHLNIWNSIKNKVPLYRRDVSSWWEINDARVVVEETDMLLWWVRCTAEDWLNLTEWMRYPVYQVSDPTNTGKISEMLNAQKFTTRPVRKWADDNLKLYWKSESPDWKWNYHMVDYWATKNWQPIEINKEWTQTKNIWWSNWSKYRPAFALSMRSVLHWDWQINFHLRWKFNNYWYLEEHPITNTDYSTSTWIDWQAFYIANWTYKLNWTTMKWNWKSAVTAWRNHWLYFRSLPNYWASTNLDDLQRWFRPQLVWALPFIKVHVWVWTENFTFYTNFYDPRTWNWQLNTHKNKWKVWDWWEMVYDWKFAEDRKRDENWFSSKFQWQWYYADASKIWLSWNEWWITWENSLYRLWSWKFQDTVLSWMIYRIDDRYSYFLDVWFCWDWFLQDYAWEKCDLWIWNWEWSTCSNTCQIQANLCWNWVIDTAAWEECDYKIFETMYVDKVSPLWLWWQTWLIYSWKNNPCYSPDDKAEYEAIWRKACQWKKPQWNITLQPYDKPLDKENWDIRNIIISDTPYYASINSCQWYDPEWEYLQDYWTNFDTYPYFLTYPYATNWKQTTALYTSTFNEWYNNLPSDKITLLKWLNSSCNLDMNKTDYQIPLVPAVNWKFWSSAQEISNKFWNLPRVWEDNWKKWIDEKIKVWSLLVNNVAIAYWYNPKSPNINTFINNSWKWTPVNKDQPECTIEVMQKWENLYDLKLYIKPWNWEITTDFLNNINNSSSVWKLELLWKTATQKLSTFYNSEWKTINISNAITKNESVLFSFTTPNWIWSCKATLKFDPQWCYTWVSNWSWINNPSTWNPFDANVWIYSF